VCVKKLSKEDFIYRNPMTDWNGIQRDLLLPRSLDLRNPLVLRFVRVPEDGLLSRRSIDFPFHPEPSEDLTPFVDGERFRKLSVF